MGHRVGRRFHEEALKGSRDGDVIREPVGAAANLPKPVLPVRPDDTDGEVIDRQFDRRPFEFAIEVGYDLRGDLLDDLKRVLRSAFNTDLRNPLPQFLDLPA